MEVKAMKKNVYQIVTDRIIELLEQGTVPWHKPWSGGGRTHEYVIEAPLPWDQPFPFERG